MGFIFCFSNVKLYHYICFSSNNFPGDSDTQLCYLSEGSLSENHLSREYLSFFSDNSA